VEVFSIRPLLAILVSALASVLILFSNNNPNRRETWTFLAAGIKFLLVASLIPLVMKGDVVVFKFFEVLPNVTASLRVDALGLTFALLSSGLWIMTSIYNVGYMRSLNEREQTRYFFCFALSLSATIGIAFAGDLFTFFVFYEVLTIATYPLVAHKETREAILGGRKYLVYSLSGAALLLAAIAWTYFQTGSLTFTPGGFLNGAMDSKHLIILFGMFIYGGAVKAALFPVHAWLPTAMVAPTPVSALLHAVAVVKAGVFAVLRIVGYVFGPDLLKESGLWHPLAWVAGFTIIAASCMAFAQDNLKRRLAYSTISQLAYIILGCAILSPDAYSGSLLHMANHGMMKITLFFCAGVIYCKTHKENISDMKGIGYQLPWTMVAFTIGVLGLSGFPLFCGFISKWFLCKGAIQTQEWAALGVYLTSALLNAGYLLPVVIQAFSKSDEKIKNVNEKNFTLVGPPIMTAVLVLIFGMIPFVILSQIQLASLAAGSVYGT